MTDPLVILPGFMADARAFLPQIIDLGLDRPVTVVMPGPGETVEQISAAALTGLPARFALLGHGLGGLIALDMLRRAPDRISRIALMATDPLSEPPAIAAAREARLVAARAGRLAEALAAEFPETALASGPWAGEIRALMLDMGLNLGAETYLRHSRLMQRRPDQQKTLRKIKVPALILAGAEDPLVPARRQDFLSALMPFGTLEVIAGAGHMPQLEQPEAVTAALRAFLAGPMLLR